MSTQQSGSDRPGRNRALCRARTRMPFPVRFVRRIERRHEVFRCDGSGAAERPHLSDGVERYRVASSWVRLDERG